MNLKKSPLGSLWFGIKVTTVGVSYLLFWVLFFGCFVSLVRGNYFTGVTLLLFSLSSYVFSRSLSQSIKEEEENEKNDDDDDDSDLYYQVKFV